MYNDPETAHCNKRIIFAGSYLDFLLFLIEHKNHLHERIQPADDTSGLMSIVNECRKRPDPTAVVDLPSTSAAEAALAEHRRKNSLHEWMQEQDAPELGSPEWWEAIKEEPF